MEHARGEKLNEQQTQIDELKLQIAADEIQIENQNAYISDLSHEHDVEANAAMIFEFKLTECKSECKKRGLKIGKMVAVIYSLENKVSQLNKQRYTQDILISKLQDEKLNLINELAGFKAYLLDEQSRSFELESELIKLTRMREMADEKARIQNDVIASQSVMISRYRKLAKNQIWQLDHDLNATQYSRVRFSISRLFGWSKHD